VGIRLYRLSSFFKGALGTRFGPRIRENRVPTGPYRVTNIFFKKTWFKD